MRIVFVDDDAQVQEGLRRMLFGRRGVWQMRFFTDAQAALTSLKDESADLVVSDLQMPAMDGAAFLERVRTLFPQTIRYILTGVLDHPLLGAAMRCSHQVIAKPCRPVQLCEVIDRAESIMQRLANIRKGSLFSGLDGLPVMPQTHRRVLDLLGSSQASPRRLGRLVAEDVGMSARLVQLANSAYFGRPGRIHDPVHAVVFLGIKTVEALVLTEGLFTRLDAGLVQRFGLSGLQAHCLRVSMLARKMSSDLHFSPERIDAASTAGILHDAGKILFLMEMKELFEQALIRSRTEGRPLYELEEESAGIGHPELAGSMLHLWGMPAEIIEATACHHRPASATSMLAETPIPTLADVISLADAIDHCFSSSGVDGVTTSPDEQRIQHFGLEEQVRNWQQHHTRLQHKETSHGTQ